jgi:microcystin-dependent protein
LTGGAGPTGPQGNPGAAGTAATIAVGTTTTGAAGSNASVTNSGSSSAAVFNFTVPQGIAGATGLNAYNITSGAFTVPAVGSTATVTLNDASWVVVGQMVYVDQAGGGVGQAGALQVTAKSGNQITLLNPAPPPAIPLASTSQAGLLNTLSGNVSDYVGGDNACHNLINALVGLLVPTGTVLDFAGSAAPTGFILCNGAAVSRTTYSALFAVLSTTYGAGDGSTTFNVPDCRGRVSLAVGQGTGLTNRVLAASGGEENHQLTQAELASHTHIQDAHGHALADAGHSHNTSFWSMGIRTDVAQANALMGPGYGTAGVYTITTGANLQANSNLSINSTTATNQNTGSSTSHNNMQPFIVLNRIIKI